MPHCAWSTLQIKAVHAEHRIIEGIASTPTPDGFGDILDPTGAQFTLPLPFLWQHNQREPIGEIFEATVSADGIRIKARLSRVETPGRLQDRLDEAWQSITAEPPLVRGLSVGWFPIEVEPVAGTAFVRFKKWMWRELSAVTIPANIEATIIAVKQHDLAASGLTLPGVTGLPVVFARKDAPRMGTIPDQIASFEATRASLVARMNELMLHSAGQTLDAAQTEEYTNAEREVESIDAHLPRLRKLEQTNLASATAITAATTATAAAALRGGTVPVVKVTSVLPKGTAFTRYVIAKIIGKNSLSDAIRYAESNQQWMDQTPEVALALKAAVNPLTVSEPAAAAPLAVQSNMSAEFLDLLRPATLIGKITGLRGVPFNVSVPIQTGGGTYAWVGEGAPKPVGNLQLASVTLGIAKAAGIIVISEELAKVSNPSAEAVVRNDMIKGMAQYLDTQFITPSVAAVTNVSPAAITNLANGYATAGTSGDNARTDLKKGITLMTAANYPIAELAFVMSQSNAFALATALTTNGVPVNPSLSITGGSILGVPTYTSEVAGGVVATIHAPSILFADDGGVSIDVSREASVEMNTTPTSPITASSAYVSLWQANLIGLRAERFINWKRARTTAVVYTTATYV